MYFDDDDDEMYVIKMRDGMMMMINAQLSNYDRYRRRRPDTQYHNIV
jgi:hypothetical protein